MFHIEAKGKYKSEDDLIQGKPLMQGAVQFEEGAALQDAFIKGFFAGLPLIIPMVILTVLKCKTYSLAFVFTTWIMTIMAIGDYANIYNAVRQVPKGAKIFNYGMHSYWISQGKR